MKKILIVILLMPAGLHAATLVTPQEMTGIIPSTATGMYALSTTGNAGTATNLTGMTATVTNLNSVTGLLGTAAFTPTSNYATSGQGTLATNALPNTGGTLSGALTIQGSLTVRTIKPTEQTPYSGQTAAPNSEYNVYFTTASGGNMTINAPTGTPVNGQKMIIRIKDDGTVRGLTFDAIYRAGDILLPTATVVNKTMYLGFMYSAYSNKWDLLGYVDNF